MWSVVAGPSPDLVPGGIVSGDRAAVIVTTNVGDAILLGGREIESEIVHAPGWEWIFQDVLFAGDWLVDAVSNDSTHESRIYRLSSGTEPILVDEWSSVVGHIPELAANGVMLWYTTRHEPGVACIVELNTTTGASTDIYCGDGGADIGWLTAHGDSLSFVEWHGSECGQLIRVLAGAPGTPESVSGPACVFHGVASDDLVAWVEPPKPDAAGYVDYFKVPVVGLVGEEPLDLGVGAAGSLEVCGDALYWEMEGEGQTPDEIRAWRPGEPINVVYRSPDTGEGRRYATTRPSCTDDGRVVIQRAGWQVDAPDELLILGQLDWVLELETAEPVGSADFDAYLAALSESAELQTWAAIEPETNLIEYAEAMCDELDRQADAERVNYIYDDDTEARWIESFSLDTDLQLWFWRQIATEHICPRYHPLTVGN